MTSPAALTDRHQDPEQEDSGRRRAAMRRNAHRNGFALSDTMVWGKLTLAMDLSGNLYRWMGNRWVQLEPVTRGARRASRVAAGAMEGLLGGSGGAT